MLGYYKLNYVLKYAPVLIASTRTIEHRTIIQLLEYIVFDNLLRQTVLTFENGIVYVVVILLLLAR